MRMGDIELRHIVDVDGQLIGFDAEVVDASAILKRAGRRRDQPVFLVRAGERTAIAAHQRIRLSEAEVLFFETTPLSTASAIMASPSAMRLAA